MKILRRSFRSRQINVQRQLPPSDWIQPWWIERFKEQTQNPEIEFPQSNDVARSWTLTGNLESVFRVAVDPRGLISVKPGFWSLD